MVVICRAVDRAGVCIPNLTGGERRGVGLPFEMHSEVQRAIGWRRHADPGTLAAMSGDAADSGGELIVLGHLNVI